MSHPVDMDTKALIFRSGQVDEFGRVWPLAVYGTNPRGRSVCAARNVYPSLYAVSRVLAGLDGWSNVHVSPDSCG